MWVPFSDFVLVLNGAYDRQVLLKNISSGKHLGATHIAFTHFDELSNSTKLWPIILHSGLSPLCICNGQNVTGDFTTSESDENGMEFKNASEREVKI